MDKKTKIIVIILAVVVVGGAIYGIQRWRQQRLVNQYLKGIYGGDVGLLNKITGGNNGITAEIAKEMAKEEAKEAAEEEANEAEEAAKTPEEKYNEVEEAEAYDANSKTTVNEAKDILEKVFDKIKLTSVYSGTYGDGSTISSVMEFEIARLTKGEDLAKLTEVLTDKGLPIIYSGIDDKSASVAAGDEAKSYTFGFEIGEQTIGVSFMSVK